MVLPTNQPLRRSNGDAFSRHGSSCRASEAAAAATAAACSEVEEVLAEISTPGARSPIHFAEGSAAASRRWRPRGGFSAGIGIGNGTRSGTAASLLLPTLFARQRAASASASPAAASTFDGRVSGAAADKHHRRTSSPLDGVCLTLLGVSTGLKTPGVDAWAVAQALVESGVDLRTRNARGMTPLHLACSAGKVRGRGEGGRSQACDAYTFTGFA